MKTLAFPGAVFVASLTLAAACAAGAFGQSGDPRPPKSYQNGADVAPIGAVSVRGQVTVIGQSQFRLRRNPYAGAASLKGNGESRATHTYTLFLASRTLPNLDVFVNPEAAAAVQ